MISRTLVRLHSKGMKGFSIIEALIAVMIITGGFLVVLSLVAASLRLSVQSRNRIYANVVASNMLEKIRAHNYGDPEPDFWKASEFSRTTVEGTQRPLVTEFKKEITYANGSFVGKTAGNFDQITLKITWEEGTGVGGEGKKKSVEVKTSVRRDGPDA